MSELQPPAEAPEDKAEAAVWIQTDGHLSGRVQLTLQLHWATEGSNCIMGHLKSGQDGEADNTERDKKIKPDVYTLTLICKKEELVCCLDFHSELFYSDGCVFC